MKPYLWLAALGVGLAAVAGWLGGRASAIGGSAAVVAQLAAVRLDIVGRRVKFKLGQNRPAEIRRRVIAELRARGRRTDGRAADAIERTLDGPR